MSAHEGGCLCGGIRYSAKSPPMRVTICHCRFCQRATGSAYLVEPIFGKSNFTVISGQPKIYRHRSEGSGKMVDVHFCENCGTVIPAGIDCFDGHATTNDGKPNTPTVSNEHRTIR